MTNRSPPAQESGTAGGPLLNPRPADIEDGPMEPESSSGGRRWRYLLICLVVLAVIGVVVAGILLRLPHRELSKWQGPGSTLHLREIVLGRCFTYIQLMRPELSNKDCQKIWNAFKNAFVYKDPCNITEEDYQPLIKLANQSLPCNKSLFWSKTNELVHQYSRVQRDLFTLEDTLLGYMMDKLKWCGDKGSSEINYASCPDWKKDCRSTSSVFWNIASKWFAEAACGEVHVMLNGSLPEAFDKNSTFGSVEIYHLHPEKVTELEAWVMHDIEGNSRNSGSDSSINQLRVILSRRNIKFNCQDDYRPVKLLQCVSHPEHPSCHLKS